MWSEKDIRHERKRRRVEEVIHILRKGNFDEAASLASSAMNSFTEQTQEPYQHISKEENTHNISASEQNEELETPRERTLEQVKISELWCEPVYYKNNSDNNSNNWKAVVTQEPKTFNICNDKICTRGNKVECNQVNLSTNDLTDNEQVMFLNARRQRRRPCIFDVLAQTINK